MTKLKPLYIIRDNIVTDKNIDKISLSSISCKEIVSIIHQSNKNMAHKIDEISFTIHSHKFFIKTNRFIKSLRLLNFQMNYQLRMLIHTIDSLDLSKCKYLITDMTYGQDIIVSNTIANHFKYLHYNFQYVAMSKMLYPQMDLADKYFLYSKKTFELYKKYSDKYYLYFPSNRNILYNNLSKKINMVLFTQPDSYTDRYLYFISLLLPLIEQNKLSVNLSIKMHYRQDKISLFNKMIEGCTNARISNPNETVESLILENDIILSMTSSVLFESLTLGKMGVIIDFDGIDSNIIYNNDLCYPDVNFVIKSIEDLSYILQNFSMYIELFKERYNKFKNTFGEYVNYDTIFDE
ncbi:MAG: hypothetical protein RBQ97_05150 [Acholeplasma sp.]|nr:hypothetical protein [Acholeplasma sp.]